MKLEHFVCLNCEHDWYEDAHYGTCSRCGYFFYLRNSGFYRVHTSANPRIVGIEPPDAKPCEPNTTPYKIQNT